MSLIPTPFPLLSLIPPPETEEGISEGQEEGVAVDSERGVALGSGKAVELSRSMPLMAKDKKVAKGEKSPLKDYMVVNFKDVMKEVRRGMFRYLGTSSKG